MAAARLREEPGAKNHTPGAVQGASGHWRPYRDGLRGAKRNPLDKAPGQHPRIRVTIACSRDTFSLLVDVLDQVAAGLAWETSIEAWRGSITQEAIAEAVRLAGYDVGRQRKCRSYLGV